MAQIPTYYVMERNKGMAETVAPMMPSAAEIAACKWLTEPEVEVYATEYGRTGFTGALQGYRVRRGGDPKSIAEMRTFSGRTIDVPSMYVAGKSDWGGYQTPGAVDQMQNSDCKRMVGCHLFDAGSAIKSSVGGAASESKTTDQTGRVVISAQFDEAGSFSEGLAPVRIGASYGYIDKQGKTVVKPQFDFAGSFSEGLAAVGIGSKPGDIDGQVKFDIGPQFEIANLFSLSEGE